MHSAGKQIPCSNPGCCLSFPSIRDLAQHLRTQCPPTQSLEGRSGQQVSGTGVTLPGGLPNTPVLLLGPARQAVPLFGPELHRDLPQYAGTGGTWQAPLQTQPLLQVRPSPPPGTLTGHNLWSGSFITPIQKRLPGPAAELKVGVALSPSRPEARKGPNRQMILAWMRPQ